MRIFIIAAIPLTLAGCMGAEQRAQQEISQDDTRCQSYGAARGSPAYVQCRQQLDTNRANVRASERFAGGSQQGAIPFLVDQLKNP